MENYRHILLVTDFSEYSEAVVKYAAKLASDFKAQLTLLHVLVYFPEDIPSDWIVPEGVAPTQYLNTRI